MTIPRFETVVRIAVLCSVLVSGWIADGRPIRRWHPETIVRETGVLVVGQVLATNVVGTVPSLLQYSGESLLQMAAKIRIIRFLGITSCGNLAPGKDIRLNYLSVNPKKPGTWSHEYDFPMLKPGDIFTFPLRKTLGAADTTYELISDEDHGLLVPSLKGNPTKFYVRTPSEFMVTELAAVFATGDYERVCRAARLLLWWRHMSPVLAERLCEFVTGRVGKNEARWLEIIVATYSLGYSPRPTLAALFDPPTGADPMDRLVAQALRHLPREGLPDRLIAIAMKQAVTHPYGTAQMLLENYPTHPTTLRLVTRSLQQHKHEALFIADFLIRNADHPLVAVATTEAERVLQQARRNDDRLNAVCRLITEYGDDRQFNVLVALLKKAQRTDRERYYMLWRASSDCANPRVLRLCRIVIEDRATSPVRVDQSQSQCWRFCDLAVFVVSHLTGVDFGLVKNQPEAAHDKAVERAKAWLAQNSTWAGPAKK